MSWSIEQTMKYDIDTSVFNDWATAADKQNPGCREVAKEACYSALYMREEGYLGGRNKTFSVRLSGHYNPNNEPVAGWSNDYVSITIAQLPPEPASV